MANGVTSTVTTYIAFIECVLHPNGHWERNFHQPNFVTNLGDVYIPKGKDAQISLVDIKNDRRYFKFTNHNTTVRIINNVVVFEKDAVEELAIDETKQFPENRRIDK